MKRSAIVIVSAVGVYALAVIAFVIAFAASL